MTDIYDGKYDDIGNVVIVKRGKNIPSKNTALITIHTGRRSLGE